MIDLTIKTLDSQNHHFSVEDGTTVGELKERILESMGINLDEQRLIFCGRVLTDERPLSECQVHGKVIHLVKRPPPSVRAPPPSTTSQDAPRSEMRQAIRDATRAIHRVANPPLRHQLRPIWSNSPLEQVQDYQQTMSPTNGRLEFIWRMMEDIRHLLRALARRDDNDSGPSGERAAPRSEPMDVEAPPSEARNNAEDNDDDMQEERNVPEQSGDNRGSSLPHERSPEFLSRPRFTQPRDLATLLEQLEQLYEQFAPYRREQINIMRELYTNELDYEETTRRQFVVDLVADAYHSFSHAYHAIGDISFPVGQRYPPLTLVQPDPRTTVPLPVQAHINVVQSGRPRMAARVRPPGHGQVTPASRPTNATAPTAVPDAPSTSYLSTQTQGSSDEDSPVASMGTPQFGTAPDPISYHVEIEARVPLALPIDNALLNGLAAVATNLQQEQTQAQPQQAQAHTAQPQDTNPSGNSQHRARVTAEIENILRGLTGGNGVEVVMSMEELSPPGGSTENVSVVGAPTISFHDGSVYLAPMPMPMMGTDATGDIMNMISSVFQPPETTTGRTSDAAWGTPTTGFVRLDSPGVVRIDSTGVTPSPRPGASQTQRPGASGSAEASTARGRDSRSEAQRNRQINVNAATLSAMARARAIASRIERNNQSPRFEERQSLTERIRRGQNHQGPAYVMNCMAYDRYLPCNSQSARVRLMERRAQYDDFYAEHERRRNTLATPMDIDVLMQRNPRFTDRHITTMIQLLVGPICQDGGLNAFLVLVARQSFMPNLQLPDVLMPGEFAFVRIQLRGILTRLFDHALRRGAFNAFNTVIESMLNRHRHYIQDLNEYTPIDTSYNLRETLRALLRARLPAILSCSMSEANSDQLAVRFYNLCTQLYIDLCSVFLHLCHEGFDGLLTVNETFMIRMTSSADSATREWLRLLSRETLTAVHRNMRPTDITQYLRRVEPRPQDTPLEDDDDEEFEVPRTCEPSNQQVMPPQVAPVPAPLPGSAAAEFGVYSTPSVSSFPQMSHNCTQTSQGATTEARLDENQSFAPRTPDGTPPQNVASPATPESTVSPSPASPQSLVSSESGDIPPSPESPPSTDSPGLVDTPDEDMPPFEEARDYTPPATTSTAHNSLASTSYPSTSARNPMSQQNGSVHQNGSSHQNGNSYRNETAYQNGGHATYRSGTSFRAGNAYGTASRLTSNPSESSSPQSSSDSVRFVPPIMILEHWGKEWVPVFTGDHSSQRERDNSEQEPYSDAYLSGMPSRKRRCVQAGRPPSTLESFMDESMRASTSRPRRFDSEQVRIALRDAVRNMARTRAETSVDYTPQRYTNTATLMRDGPQRPELIREINTNVPTTSARSNANETKEETKAPTTTNDPDPEHSADQEL